jgi:ribonuclease HI
MIFHAFTDGASRGNPGESGIGMLARTETGVPVLAEHGYIGAATNNIAEYTALITLLKRARRWKCTRLIVHSDSELMVRQINGVYRVRDEVLRGLHTQATGLLTSLPFPVELRHVARAANSEADRLANMGIDTRKRISR